MNRTKTDRALSAMRAFWESELDEILSRAASVDASASALELFHAVARDVPAYRTFLERAGVDVDAVRTTADFARLPTTTKDNYTEPSRFTSYAETGGSMRVTSSPCRRARPGSRPGGLASSQTKWGRQCVSSRSSVMR